MTDFIPQYLCEPSIYINIDNQNYEVKDLEISEDDNFIFFEIIYDLKIKPSNKEFIINNNKYICIEMYRKEYIYGYRFEKKKYFERRIIERNIIKINGKEYILEDNK